jgi:hypothetical protein
MSPGRSVRKVCKKGQGVDVQGDMSLENVQGVDGAIARPQTLLHLKLTNSDDRTFWKVTWSQNMTHYGRSV